MDTITKVDQSYSRQGLKSDLTFIMKLTNSKFDSFAGSELLFKIESWISAHILMNSKEVPILIVDLGNVEFIDSQGLQKLLTCLKLMQSQNSNLLLCSLQPPIHLVFEITRIDQLFAIFPCFDTCMDQFSIHNPASDYLVAA